MMCATFWTFAASRQIPLRAEAVAGALNVEDRPSRDCVCYANPSKSVTKKCEIPVMPDRILRRSALNVSHFPISSGSSGIVDD